MPARGFFRNVGALPDPTARSSPDLPAFIEVGRDRRVSYGTLVERLAATAAALQDHGVEQGDRVVTFYPTELEALYLFFGAMRIGAVPVPVNPRLQRSSLEYIVSDTGASVVVTSDAAEIRDRAVSVAETVAAVDTILVDGGTEDTAASAGPTASLGRPDGGSYRPSPTDVAADDPALQLYTSGSTGKPKGVILDHGGVYWNTHVTRQVNLLDEDERLIVVTPLFHKMATVNIKAALLAGASVVILPEFSAEAMLAAIDQHDVTFLTGVPTVYERLLDDPDRAAEYDLSSVATGVCGADLVPSALHDEFAAVFDATLIENYGLTEGGPMVTSTPRWGIHKRGSCGLALPGVETRIVPTDGVEELPPGEVGELLVSSPGVGRFHDRPDLTAELFERIDGRRFLRTGDLASRDEDGYHEIVGRTDDMLVVGGENVYPSEVEDLLQGHPAVETVAVVGVPHADKGEAPVAFVVPAADVTETDLKEFALERGPAYAHPRRVLFRETLPVSGTEKVDRQALERAARETIDRLG